MDRHRSLDRLSPLDVSNLRVEEHGQPMHVAALVILDQTAFTAAPDHDRLAELQEIIAPRLPRAPRLHQLLYRPRSRLGTLVWADDQDFDIRRHVLSRPVPEPGDEAAMLRVCAELNRPPLDRSRPLWQLWLLTGLAGDRCALLIRWHHVVADGIAALGMLGALFDPEPQAPILAPPSRTRSPVPHRPGAPFARLAVRARQAGQLAREGRAPRLSLNVPVTGRSRLRLIRADLEQVRTVAHAHGGTVNDVVLAAVAGGARYLLQSRGELRPGLAVKVSVTVSMRDPADQRATGNRVGIMIVPVPVSETDPDRLLAGIATATAARKRLPPYSPAGRLAQRWMVGVMSHQRMVNLLVSNLHGPPAPLCLGGGRVLELFQIGAVQGNLSVIVGAISYAGQLNLDIVSDEAAVPDVEVFAAGMTATLGQLGVLVTGIPALPGSLRYRSGDLEGARVHLVDDRCGSGPAVGRPGLDDHQRAGQPRLVAVEP